MVKSLSTHCGYPVDTMIYYSENLKVAIAQLCHDIEVCNFTVIADQKFCE